LSNDGLTLYFASVRRDGFGAADIYATARSTDANACTPLTCISRLDLYAAPVSCR
jgi:hypothetical protein